MHIRNGNYRFFSEHLSPNGHKCVYTHHLNLSFTNGVTGKPTLTLGERTAEEINGKPPEEFDFVMSCLGNALYPLRLRTDNLGNVQEIVNDNEVRERYVAEGRRIMDYYEHGEIVVGYVERSFESMLDEKTFVQRISQSNVCQLATMFMDIANCEYRLADFPFLGDVIRFRLSVTKEYDEDVVLTITEVYTEREILSFRGKAYVHKAGKGTLDHIQLLLEVEIANEGFYTRRLEIKWMEDRQ